MTDCGEDGGDGPFLLADDAERNMEGTDGTGGMDDEGERGVDPLIELMDSRESRAVSDSVGDPARTVSLPFCSCNEA